MADQIKFECKSSDCSNDAVIETLEPIAYKHDYWKHNSYLCSFHFGVMVFEGRIPRSWRVKNL